ncbi:metal-sulfur cluster assembly factor [Paracoccus sp. (in: a-proteobacteria)]|uniref:metal-sulfur cluster assembly factor n=1 Tax=Paracoccus sp. TaxID=267 RepID=UPI0032201A98
MNGAGPELRPLVEGALAGIIDPETGTDLLAMGLVRAIAISGTEVSVTMTTTTPGCPLASVLRLGAETAVAAVPGVTRAEVVLRHDPPWSPERIGRGVWE